MSQQQEVNLGADAAAQVSAQLPLIRDAAVVSYINSIGNKLAQTVDTRGLAWHFAVVDSREVNAFALPGGWIYVNRGRVDRLSQLVADGVDVAHHRGVANQRQLGADLGPLLRRPG